MTERTILEWPEDEYTSHFAMAGQWSYGQWYDATGNSTWFYLSLHDRKREYKDETMEYVEVDGHGTNQIDVAKRRTVAEVKQLAQRLQDMFDGVAPDESVAKLERRLDDLEITVGKITMGREETKRQIDEMLVTLKNELQSGTKARA